MAKDIPITEFDMTTLNPSLQILKVLIPFFDFHIQKMLSYYIRINELQQTINFYNFPSNANIFSSCNFTASHRKIHTFNDIIDNQQLMDTLIKYCPESAAKNINMLRQLMKMSDLFNIINSATDTDGNIDFSNMDFSKMKLDGLNFNNIDFGNIDFSKINLNNTAGENINNKDNANKNAAAGKSREPNTSSSQSSDKSNSFNNGFNISNLLSGNFNQNSFMRPEQQKLYDEYLKELDKIDFDRNSE